MPHGNFYGSRGRGVVEEQVKEVPAPSRRISLVAEAHELGHFGAEKTAQRLWALGFDWVGLTQDCEAITSVCRPCARDNAHRAQWAPALSLEVPHRVFERVHMDLLLLPLVEVGESGGNFISISPTIRLCSI